MAFVTLTTTLVAEVIMSHSWLVLNTIHVFEDGSGELTVVTVLYYLLPLLILRIVLVDVFIVVRPLLLLLNIFFRILVCVRHL